MARGAVRSRRIFSAAAACSCLILAAHDAAAAHPPVRPGTAAHRRLRPRIHTLERLFAGGKYPLTLRLSQLNSRWRRIVVRPSLDPSGYSPLLSSALGDLTQNVAVYYSRGAVVPAGRQRYLIAYRAQINRPQYEASTGLPPPRTDRERAYRVKGLAHVTRLTANTTLHLSLLNLALCGHFLDIRPFHLADEIADINRPARNVSGVFSKARLQAANFGSVANLKHLGLAVILYAQDHNEQLPPLRNESAARAALQPYLRDARGFESPADHVPYRANTRLDGMSLARIADPATTPIFYESSPSEDGTRGVLYVSGRAERLDSARWASLRASAHLP